jgi:choline dehydrogenase-like flavoprotein
MSPPWSADGHAPEPETVDLTKLYDVLIVGSGAAGGMAAHVLTAHGLDVLMLEAGRQVDFDEEVRSMEWPYHHPRRGKLPPDTYVLDEADYKRLKPPYAQSLGRYTNVMNWQQLGEGPDYTKKFFVNEKDHPYTGTNFSWVRSRALGGKTNRGTPGAAAIGLRLQRRAATATETTGRSNMPTWRRTMTGRPLLLPA